MTAEKQRRPIIDSTRLLEVPMCEISEKESVLPMEYVICAIDIGSTNPKVEVWKYDPTKKDFTKKPIHIEWGDYEAQIENVSHHRIKFLDAKHTEALLTLIQEQVKEALEGEEFNQNKQLVFAITGFGHNLTITDNKSGQSAVILDDPSVFPELSARRKNTLAKQLEKINKDLDSLAGSPTSLPKLLWLLQHPEALRRLFNTNEEIDFGQLSFSVVRSLISSRILGGDKTKMIAANEKPDFALPISEELPEIVAFLEKIGIKPWQLLFAHTQLMTSNMEDKGDVIIYDQKDLPAELKVLAWAIEQGIISEDGTIICADSVGKIISSEKVCPDNRAHDKASGTSYETQRILANVNKYWMGPLILKHGETMNRDAYKKIDAKIKEMMEAEPKIETPYVYVPTEKGKGIVYKLEDGKYVEKRRTEIKNWQESEKDLVMLAVAKGAIFGIRQKMEHIRRANNANMQSSVSFYGGLLGHPQIPGGKDGWRKIFMGAMPKGAEIYEIGIPSGATAVAFGALDALLSDEDNAEWQNKFNSVTAEKVGVGGDLEEEFQKWKEAQEKMIDQDLLERSGNCKVVKKV